MSNRTEMHAERAKQELAAEERARGEHAPTELRNDQPAPEISSEPQEVTGDGSGEPLPEVSSEPQEAAPAPVADAPAVETGNEE